MVLVANWAMELELMKHIPEIKGEIHYFQHLKNTLGLTLTHTVEKHKPNKGIRTSEKSKVAQERDYWEEKISVAV